MSGEKYLIFVDICWYLKEQEQQIIKLRKLSDLPGNSGLKKWFRNDLMNIFLNFSLRQAF